MCLVFSTCIVPERVADSYPLPYDDKQCLATENIIGAYDSIPTEKRNYFALSFQLLSLIFQITVLKKGSNHLLAVSLVMVMRWYDIKHIA